MASESSKGMRILVTGGAGYVGSACLRHLLAHGFDAVAYDNLVQGHRQAVPEGRLIVADINDGDALRDALKQVRADAVMHFAAATCVGESVENPEYHYGNNIGGTRSLLNAMRDCGVKRMLFSSTCATYGMNPKVPMTEDAAQDPCSPYARTKLVVEWMIRDFAQAYGLGFTLLRYFNASGASPDGQHGEDHHPENHLIPLTLEVPLGRRPKLLVFGDDYPTPDGTCIRDYVHVEDLAQAHRLAIQATEPKTGEVYNIGTGHGCSVLQIIRACEDVTGKKIPFDVVQRRPGDAPALVASPEKLMSRLGWAPKYTDIRETIRTAWKWHQSHPDGYGDRVPSVTAKRESTSSSLRTKLAESIRRSGKTIGSLEKQTAQLEGICNAVTTALKRGNKVLTAGHGGSAADAMHMAEELVGRFKANRRSLPAIALVADPTLMTCIANDFGFAHVFPRQVEALGQKGDVLVIFSTSGNGDGFRMAVDAARRAGVTSIALLGKSGGPLRGQCDLELIVEGDETARIQEAHTLILHLVLEAVEDEFTTG